MTERRDSYVDRKIIVRKSVCAAAQKLMKEAKATAGVSPVQLAEKKINACHAVKEKQFWRDVWTHLMLLKQKYSVIQIIEDD